MLWLCIDNSHDDIDEAELSEAGLFDGVTWVHGATVVGDDLEDGAADEIALSTARVSS